MQMSFRPHNRYNGAKGAKAKAAKANTEMAKNGNPLCGDLPATEKTLLLLPKFDYLHRDLLAEFFGCTPNNFHNILQRARKEGYDWEEVELAPGYMVYHVVKRPPPPEPEEPSQPELPLNDGTIPAELVERITVQVLNEVLRALQTQA